jgi:Leucine-rich repeat (LRR) protein
MRLPKHPLENLFLYLFPPKPLRVPTEIDTMESQLQSFQDGIVCVRKDAAGENVEQLILVWRSGHNPGARQSDPPSSLKAIWNLSKIHYLTLSGCPNHVFQGKTIGRLTTLKTLHLDDMETIPQEIGLLCNLVAVCLSNCRTIDVGIRELRHVQSLKTLLLDSVESIPPEIGLLRSLETVCLWNCYNDVDVCIQELRHVQTVSIRYATSRAPPLRDSLTQMRTFQNLQKLCFSGMRSRTMLELFSEPWTESTALTEVEMSDCNLNDDWSNILPGLPKSLTVLGLDENGIQDLHPFVEHGLPVGIQTISVLSNPVKLFRDDCQEAYLAQLLDTYPQLGVFQIEAEFPSSAYVPVRLFYKMLYNRRGRVLLEDASNHAIPLSVWPLVLERAAMSITGEGLDDFLLLFQLLGMPLLESNSDENMNRVKRKYEEVRISVLYNLLRKQPTIIACDKLPTGIES